MMMWMQPSCQKILSTHKLKLWRFLLLTLAIALLIGCAQNPHVPGKVISQQEAVDAALKIASVFRPELSGSPAPPSNIHAEQMTLGEAMKHIGENNNIGAGYTPNMLVWFVTMDGIWLDDFPRPTDLPTPEPYRHCTVIIDAGTGLQIELSLRP